MLEHFFQAKNKWKKDTFNLIKNDLLSIKSNRFVQYNQSSSTHLVCVYGKSQVGKTTLILNMIGLKEEWKNNVSNVLRGGVTRGNSSTSTAIIYSQNNSDNSQESNKYGLRIETLDSSVESFLFDYYSSDEMKKQLKAIRDKVENNEFSTKNILHISIPNDYFSSSVTNNKISILDLPGVESRNKKEKAHVDSLMTRYIPLSSVCIIACPANVIQSLENEEISKDLDWKKCAHKFLLVLTKAYSDGSIKSYFNSPRKNRTSTFREFVEKRYRDELANVIGKNNKIEVYPLDLGDSFEKLLTDEIHNLEDCKEIRSTRDSILTSLQESIVNHKGEQLLSTIKELHLIVEHFDEERIIQLQENKKKVEDELKDNRKKVDKYVKDLDTVNQELDSLLNFKKQLSKLRKEIDNLSHSANTITKAIVSNVKSDIVSKNLSKSGYLNDPQKICLTTIRKILSSSIKRLVISKAMSLMEECKLSIDLYASKIVNSIYFKYTYQYEDKIYPSPSGLLKKVISSILPHFGPLFGNTPKVSLDELYRIIQNIEHIIQAEIRSLVISSCISLIDKKNKDYQQKIDSRRSHISKIKVKINSIKTSNEESVGKIQEIKKDIEIVKSQKERDKQTLNKYLQYCEIAYLRQRDDIIKRINSNTSKEERILYLLLLGVIDKEYNIILNTSNE